MSETNRLTPGHYKFSGMAADDKVYQDIVVEVFEYLDGLWASWFQVPTLTTGIKVVAGEVGKWNGTWKVLECSGAVVKT